MKVNLLKQIIKEAVKDALKEIIAESTQSKPIASITTNTPKPKLEESSDVLQSILKETRSSMTREEASALLGVSDSIHTELNNEPEPDFLSKAGVLFKAMQKGK